MSVATSARETDSLTSPLMLRPREHDSCRSDLANVALYFQSPAGKYPAATDDNWPARPSSANSKSRLRPSYNFAGSALGPRSPSDRDRLPARAHDQLPLNEE